MNFAKLCVLSSAAWAVCACAATVQPPEPVASESNSQESNGDTSAIDAVIARCTAVQRSAELPITCKVDVVGDVLRMQLVMANRQVAAQYAASAVKQIATPFCDLANQASAPAGIVLALHEERIMQVADCASGTFSDWQPVDKEAQEMLAATRACEALQESNYPVGCGIGDLDGTTSLVVSYMSGRVTPDALGVIASRVGAPFCDATRSSGINAVILLVEDNRRAQAFDCSTSTSSGWVAIRANKPPKQGSGSKLTHGASNPTYRPSFTKVQVAATR